MNDQPILFDLQPLGNGNYVGAARTGDTWNICLRSGFGTIVVDTKFKISDEAARKLAHLFLTQESQ